MNVNSLRKMLFFSTVHIRAGNAEAEWTGTGFFYATTHVAIATNRHVLEGAEWFEFTALRRSEDGTSPQIGRGLRLRVDGPGVETWLRHPDDRVDVAIFPAAQLFDHWVRMSGGQQPYYHAVTAREFADFDQLDAIEDVTFIGYPDGLVDEANLTPIARHGRTATPPELDYSGRPTFLIDAPVFGGSSGSPVFVLRDALVREPSGAVVLGTPRVLFAGLVAAVHIRPTELQVVDPAQERLVGSAVMEQELGLGIVFKPRTLLEVMEEADRQGRT